MRLPCARTADMPRRAPRGGFECVVRRARVRAPSKARAPRGGAPPKQCARPFGDCVVPREGAPCARITSSNVWLSGALDGTGQGPLRERIAFARMRRTQGAGERCAATPSVRHARSLLLRKCRAWGARARVLYKARARGVCAPPRARALRGVRRAPRGCAMGAHCFFECVVLMPGCALSRARAPRGARASLLQMCGFQAPLMARARAPLRERIAFARMRRAQGAGERCAATRSVPSSSRIASSKLSCVGCAYACHL